MRPRTPRRAAGDPIVTIEIVRAARLALFDTNVQTLEPGEIYTVAPAVGAVLVADGWAREVTAPAAGPLPAVAAAPPAAPDGAIDIVL